MAYTKTQWKDHVLDGEGNVVQQGTPVNASNLNKMEEGIRNAQEAAEGKAPASHGTHVPATETADNAKFLRNDNTWQKVTPENIGAAPSQHTHPADESRAPMYLYGTEDLTAGRSELATGQLYFVYE